MGSDFYKSCNAGIEKKKKNFRATDPEYKTS